ncbi:hypothetical protein AVEN_118000-1 [Araneus ventricosus]|uniref:Uncharacterized protein n=1 Tax=Araneus ventricosus TaxID=182803 RepID=A0A4Y2CA45_ARAVE|nr:hypothetical protein AVEN_118000-1 [Araneus ventricosus]
MKYLCKYVNKVPEMTVFEIISAENNLNEIYQYQMGRYISSNEAVWIILNFPIHERYPTVIHLSVQFENSQRDYFRTENDAKRAQAPEETALTPVFRLRTQDEFKYAPYCTMKYPSTTLLTMETRHGKVENKGRLY